MLYALADRSPSIRLEHLRAALALWSYCRASARLIFGGEQKVGVIPDPLWLRLMNAIASSPGVSRTGLREVAGHKVKGEEIESALASLEKNRMAHHEMVQPSGAGRPAGFWGLSGVKMGKRI